MDPREFLASLSKFNPVTAIPGMVQQGQQAVDPYVQMLMQYMQQAQQPQAPGVQGAPAQPAPLKQRMTK